ncbi:MAG: Uma2 family endonuclease [Candidatus Promineifilaceae bacterium]
MAIQSLPVKRIDNKTGKVSYEDFLEWADENTHAEWVNGEVIIFMATKNVHQNVVELLHVMMNLFVSLLNLGKVRIAPFQMRLENSGREPDILFITNAHMERLQENRLDGPADLVVEVVSPESVRRDREDKYKEYREAGIREYWVIDPRPDKQRADFYYLNEEGDYELFATEDDEQVYSKVLEGFWIRPSWLWQTDEIDPFVAFCEIRGLSAEQVSQIQGLLRSGEESVE